MKSDHKGARRLKISRQLLSAGLVLYVLLCTACASFQRRLIYFPPKYGSDQVDAFARSSGLERWRDSAGRAIGMWRPSAQRPAEGRILIVYGNGSCATACAHYADVIQRVAPFDVYILEYPGYADRPGSPSERNLFHAAGEAFQMLAASGPVYVVGESLGTGVAAYLAGSYPDRVAGIALLGAYNRLTDVAQVHMPFLPVHLLLVDRFPSEDYLRHFRGPVAVLVAGRDRVVPEKFGRRLYDKYDGPKRLWDFPLDDHDTLMMRSPAVWDQVIQFLLLANRGQFSSNEKL